MKVACTVWGGGKVGDNFKDLPIVKSAYSERFIPLRGGTHLISITGDLSTELYQKKDGSTGESIKCLISSFYYIPVGDGKKKEQQNQNGQQANGTSQYQPNNSAPQQNNGSYQYQQNGAPQYQPNNAPQYQNRNGNQPYNAPQSNGQYQNNRSYQQPQQYAPPQDQGMPDDYGEYNISDEDLPF